MKRLVDYHLTRLRDRRPDIRLSAIHELELLEAEDALDTLRHVFETDPNEEVRQAAKRAGRTIYFKTRQGNGTQTD